MDFLALLVQAGPTGIVAGLFVFVLDKILRSNAEQLERHREEITEMRKEHIQQVNNITEKFSNEIKILGAEFTAGMTSLREGMNNITEEVRDVRKFVHGDYPIRIHRKADNLKHDKELK